MFVSDSNFVRCSLPLYVKVRDVNKDLTPKDQDKDKDLTTKDKDKDKDLTPRTRTRTRT